MNQAGIGHNYKPDWDLLLEWQISPSTGVICVCRVYSLIQTNRYSVILIVAGGNLPLISDCGDSIRFRCRQKSEVICSVNERQTIFVCMHILDDNA